MVFLVYAQHFGFAAQQYFQGYCGNFLNDVAVLVLQDVIRYLSTIRAIPLASSDIPVGSAVLMSGWGHLSTGGATARHLQWNTQRSVQEELHHRYSHEHQQPSLLVTHSGQGCLPG